MSGALDDPTTVLVRGLAAEPPENVVVVYLFGAHAEGRAHRESDVDLGVLLRHDRLLSARDRFEAGVQLTARLTGALGGVSADVVILNDAPPRLAARVATTGRVLYCADSETEHAFRRDVQLRAADLEPFLRRTREIKLQAIHR